MSLRATVYVLIVLMSIAGKPIAQTKASAPEVAEIVFESGSLKQYEELLRTKFTNPNIVLDGDVGETTLPRVRLRVSLAQALQWVAGTADARNRYITLQTTSGPIYTFTTTQAQVARAAAAAKETFIKTYVQSNSDGSWTRPTDAAVKDVLSGLLQKRDSGKRGVDFDEKTRLLIVTGNRSDIQIADQVIDEMTRGRRAAAATTSMQTEIGRLTALITKLEALLTELRKSK